MTDKKIEIIKAAALELDPSKKYVFSFKAGEISLDDMAQFGKALKEMGITGVSIVLHDPNDLRVIQQ